MKYTRIENPNLSGWKASVGDRSVELIEAYQGEWFWYAKIGEAICKGFPAEMIDGQLKLSSYREVKKWGDTFLKGEITPELWPIRAAS